MNNSDSLNQNNGNVQNNMNLNYSNSSNVNYNNQNVNQLNNNFPNNSTPNNINNTKSKKKLLLFIIGGLLLIAIVLFVGYKFFENKNSDINVIFDDALIKVKKDDKYGYINSNGKFVLEPVYEVATDFQGNYAMVKTTVNIEGTNREIYQLIDKKGNAKAQAEYSTDIKYVSEYNIWIINDQLYNSSLKKISSDKVKVKYEKYGYLSWEDVDRKSAGIMDTSGKVTYTYKYQTGEDYFSITPSDTNSTLTERYCITNVDNEKYAIVNCDTGKLVYDYTENYILDEDDNIFQVSKRDPWEFVTLMYVQNNEIAYQTNSKNVDLNYYSSGYVLIRDEDKDYSNRYSYLDVKTGNILSSQPSNNNSDVNINLNEWETLTGMTKKSCGNGYGLVKGEEEILPCEWYSIDYFGSLLYQYLTSKGKNYVMARKDDKTYIVDLKNGKTVAEFDSSYIYDDETSTFIYYKDSSTNEKIIYNLITGRTLKTSDDNSLNVYSNYITIKENNKKNYYNTNLKLIYSEEE